MNYSFMSMIYSMIRFSPLTKDISFFICMCYLKI